MRLQLVSCNILTQRVPHPICVLQSLTAALKDARTENGTPSKEQGAAFKGHGALSKEPGALSKEPGALSKERSALSKEQDHAECAWTRPAGAIPAVQCAGHHVRVRHARQSKALPA